MNDISYLEETAMQTHSDLYGGIDDTEKCRPDRCPKTDPLSVEPGPEGYDEMAVNFVVL